MRQGGRIREIEGVQVLEERRGFLRAALGDLYIAFWCPDRDYIFDIDPLELVDELRLQRSDALIVVAYRPLLLIDEIQSVLDRLNRWYGRELEIKLFGVNAGDLEEGLEEAVGHAMAYKPFKIGSGAEWADVCPNCSRGRLRAYVDEKLFSAKYGRVHHLVLGCPMCGFRIRRIEVLD
ncbi:MAG: hypothetical protein JZD41_01025 [Thermoproteus sp.]|nr:hypothetical protein [Thermoproteus sp.]